MGPHNHIPAGRSVVSVGDHRMNRALVRDAYRYASLSEYSAATGIEVSDIVAMLGPCFDAGLAGIETYAGEVFLLTAPKGRPVPAHLPEIAPNMWEALRNRASLSDAWSLWRVARSMGRAGWSIEVDPAHVAGSLSHLMTPPVLGVRIGEIVAPVIVGPAASDLEHSTGLLAEYDRARAGVLCVACKNGTLDSTVTAARKWALGQHVNPSTMTVVVLEAPRYQPVVLTAGDASVAPVSVTREHVFEAFGRPA